MGKDNVMTELFRNRDKATVGHFQSLLESEGIQTFVRNQELASTALPLAEFTPALCVVNDEDTERAVEMIRGYLEAKPAEASADLVCPQCGETCPGNFANCWSCDAPLAG